ncbi:uncharacterized protein LOC130794642 [Actinidia eriantha]|uniref:uncharacterized protein LOC130794642 n=1 Tax=Actinidia eriantha TaxID=165200 RepID=UPI002582AABE|nr:uncharacterized protein LOC130794642 [Actinidia eriantha]
MNPTDAYRKELRKKELKRMIYMYLVQVLFSAMPPNNECGEEEEEGGLSEDSEREQEVWSEDINATQDGKEATKNCEDRVEEPKKRMTFLYMLLCFMFLTPYMLLWLFAAFF